MKMPKLSLIKGDWGLRLLALILAIVIYHALKTETDKAPNDNETHFFQYR